MIQNFFKVLIFCLSILSITAVYAQIELPALVSNDMILQRDVEIPIWGWAAAGEQVEITFNNKKYTTKAGADKKWNIKLPAMKAGGPYEMTIKASNTINIKNILIGDVWLCGGQSNMEMQLNKIPVIYDEEVANSTNPNIRSFVVQKANGLSGPVEKFKGSWKLANPENVKDFSAVPYFFAKMLYDKYKVPIGLINSSWGGSHAEAWISEESLKPFPHYYNLVNKYQNSDTVNKIKSREKRAVEDWYKEIYAKDTDYNKLYIEQSDTVFANWKTAAMPNHWDSFGLKNNNGIVWIKREIELSAATLAKGDAVLSLGLIEDEDQTYINGKLVGEVDNKYNVRYYSIPSGVLQAGKNVILMRILNYGDKGGFVKDKDFLLKIGEEKIDLAGQWHYKETSKHVAKPVSTSFKNHPANLYNAMIAPIKQYAIKGVIWYQGEGNSSKPKEYQTLFSAVITDWRRQFNQGDFPFLFVQLPNFNKVIAEPSESSWAEIREAQAMALKLPNTGMAITLGLGEWNNVHPAKKKDVGLRLSLLAQKIAYKENNIVYSGPILKSAEIKGNKYIIEFNLFGSKGLKTINNEVLEGFAIAGEDKKFVWAKAEIKDNKVIVWADGIDKPIALRYAWASNPSTANLINKEGLPASGFRTDDWPGVNFKKNQSE